MRLTLTQLAYPALRDIGCLRPGLVTLDLDFANIRAYPPAEYPGIVVLRPNKREKRSVLALVHGNVHVLANRAPALSFRSWNPTVFDSDLDSDCFRLDVEGTAVSRNEPRGIVSGQRVTRLKPLQGRHAKDDQEGPDAR
jgi:hypothetical protein